jgi:hypothetical protein
LANALKNRFSFKEVVIYHREDLALRPSVRVKRTMSCGNFAISIPTRFEQTDQMEDLEERFIDHQNAPALRPSSHQILSIFFHNLAGAMYICSSRLVGRGSPGKGPRSTMAPSFCIFQNSSINPSPSTILPTRFTIGGYRCYIRSLGCAMTFLFASSSTSNQGSLEPLDI